MVLQRKDQDSSDDEVDSAESAVGAMEEGLGEGAVAPATGGESSSAPAALAQDSQPPPNTQPPGSSSARRPESPLPPPRAPSALLNARLAELNRQRDHLRDILHPLNVSQLDEWVTIQERRDYLVRASFCQTSNDVLLAEVRRLRLAVTEALQQITCPSSPMFLLRGALEQVLSNIPSVIDHLRSPRPHAELEEGISPSRPCRFKPLPPPDPRWTSDVGNKRPLFRNAEIPMYPDPYLDAFGQDPPRDVAAPADDVMDVTSQGRSSPGHIPIVPGQDDLSFSENQPRVINPAILSPWDRSDHGGSNGTSNGGDVEQMSVSQRRRERRRARSEEYRSRHPSPEPLLPGDTIIGLPRDTSPVVVVVAGGHRLSQRWISPSFLQAQQDAIPSESPASEDNIVDVTASPGGPLASTTLVLDNFMNGSRECSNGEGLDDHMEQSVDISLPPLPLPVLPPAMLEQHGPYIPTLQMPEDDHSSAARTRPITSSAAESQEGHFSYAQADYPYRETYPSSTHSSPQLVFSFTDEQELGIRSSRLPTSLERAPFSTSSTSQSKDDEDPPAPRRSRARKKRSAKTTTSSESKKGAACAAATSSSTTDTRTDSTTNSARTDSTTDNRTTDSTADTRTEDDDEDTTAHARDDYDTSMTVQDISDDEKQGE